MVCETQRPEDSWAGVLTSKFVEISTPTLSDKLVGCSHTTQPHLMCLFWEWKLWGAIKEVKGCVQNISICQGGDGAYSFLPKGVFVLAIPYCTMCMKVPSVPSGQDEQYGRPGSSYRSYMTRLTIADWGYVTYPSVNLRHILPLLCPASLKLRIELSKNVLQLDDQIRNNYNHPSWPWH